MVNQFVAKFILPMLVGQALLAGACGGNNSGTTTAPSSSSGLVTIFITNGVYSPNPLTVKVGQQVNWKNNDSIAHTATMAGAFDTGSIAPTSAADVPVSLSAGTYAFHCTIHSGENGTIVVQP